MTVDQGGKTGTLVNFFGRSASMATGAVRIALKYGTTILPIFFTRLGGPYVKLFIDKPFEVKKTGDRERDIRENLQELMYIYEKYIATYPEEYLWTYKVWKYGLERKILILSDAKTGHLRQSQAVADIAQESLREKGFDVKIETVEVKFRNKFSSALLKFSSCLSGKYNCQGCLICLKRLLDLKSYNAIIGQKPDIIISCGSSVAVVNYLLSRENLSKSMVLMKPSVLSIRKFNLVIVPKHDNPPKRKNVIVTEGALNLINEEYLREQTDKLIKVQGLGFKVQGFYIGLLIGGDAKNFHLQENVISGVIKQVKSACEKLGADILVTTSRRTAARVEGIIKKEFKDYARCKLLVIANEKNIPEAIGGILGLSQIIITSPESISMISEAVNSKKYVLVFKTGMLNKKHARFLNNFSKSKYICLTENISDLSKNIEDIWVSKPQIHTLSDNILIKEAIGRVL
jgi:mitochondrial fission protein ELM1